MVSGLHDLFDDSSDAKRELLQRLGLLQGGSLDNAQLRSLPGLLASARVHCLSKIELYFLQNAEQLRAPLNLRNEAAAVSLLLAYFAEPQQEQPAGAAQHGDGATDGGEAAGDAAIAAGAGADADSGGAAGMLGELRRYSEILWPDLASKDVTLAGGGGGGSGGGASAGAAPAGTGAATAAAQQEPPRGVPAPPGSASADFEAWAREQGVQAAITIASFASLRGCAATRDVTPGECLLSIPAGVLIYEDTVKQTDLGRMLMAIPGLTIDNLLIIFTMADRHDADSQWTRYWRSLPDKYYTGLSFPQELVDQLGGTAAALELARAQAHLQQQYADTRPLFAMLLDAYPQFLQADWFEYESYLWAAELWYSYAFEVEFPGEGKEEQEQLGAGSDDSKVAPSAQKSRSAAGGGGRSSNPRRGKPGKPPGGGARRAAGSSGSSAAGPASSSGSSSGGGGSSKPVMVPFACHLNHSPWPHCVRYGRLNPRTRTLDYPAFRPCLEGQQVFISYGPVPNLKLLCYYGFVVPSNPHDLVPLQLEMPDGPLRERQAAALAVLGLGLEHSLQDGPLSKQLLACLRVIVATLEELQLMEKQRAAPLEGPVNGANEEQAVGTLRAALQGMLGPLEALPLLAGGADVAGHGGSGGGGSSSGGAEEQLDDLHLAATEEQEQLPPQPPQPPQHEAACNENGFDADWRMSRHFCRVYLRGQCAILRRSLAECDALL